MKVIVATYEHRYGKDTGVFASQAGAERWRQELAREYWHEWMDDEDVMPDDPVAMADAYWNEVGNYDNGEWFSYEELEVIE